MASTVEVNEDGVDLGVTVCLHFSAGKMATLVTDLRVDLPNIGHVSGTKGAFQVVKNSCIKKRNLANKGRINLQIDAPFWCPTSFRVNGQQYEKPLPEGAKFEFHFTNSQGLMYEAEEVRRCLKEKLVESPKMTWDESLLISEIQTEINRQIGVNY